MSSDKRDLLPGTLDMLILKTISVSPMHGYGIAQHIKRLSRDVLQVEEGSLYPALQRLRQRGWLKAEWGQTPNNQRARYYTITAKGRQQLGEEEAGFGELVAAIQRVMRCWAVSRGACARCSEGARSTASWTRSCVTTSNARPSCTRPTA